MAGGGYQSENGTSFSALIVAGVAALVWSTSYGTSTDAVVKRICDTSDKITGTGTYWKCGRINAFKAVGGTADAPAASPTQAQPNTTGAPGGNSTPPPAYVFPTTYCLGGCPTIAENQPPTQTPLIPTVFPPTTGPDLPAIGDILNPSPTVQAPVAPHPSAVVSLNPTQGNQGSQTPAAAKV